MSYIDKKSPINLLWTGGWDSTFRLLQLLLEKKREVQPYYLVSGIRKSTDIEIRTMDKIKEKLFKSYPFTQNLLLSTRYVNEAEVKIDHSISESYEIIKTQNYIGNQYVIIANFGKQFLMDGLELCIHLDDKAHEVLKPYAAVMSEDEQACRLLECNSPTHLYQLFGYFTFPIFNYSKIDMEEIAKDQNWIELMNLTWFCHRPFFGKIPCGICNPCIYTIEEGLGSRIPFLLRISGKYVKRIYNSKLVLNIRKYSR